MDKFGWTLSMAIASVLMFWFIKYGGIGAGAFKAFHAQQSSTPASSSTSTTKTVPQ